MTEDKTIRLGHRSIDMYDDVEVCPHITIANGNLTDEPCEYIEKLQVYCEVCEQEYRFTIMVN